MKKLLLLSLLSLISLTACLVGPSSSLVVTIKPPLGNFSNFPPHTIDSAVIEFLSANGESCHLVTLDDKYASPDALTISFDEDTIGCLQSGNGNFFISALVEGSVTYNFRTTEFSHETSVDSPFGSFEAGKYGMTLEFASNFSIFNGVANMQPDINISSQSMNVVY